MSEHLEQIGATDTAQHAAQRMKEKNVSSLVVLYENGRAAGIITERDFVRRLSVTNQSSDKVKVIELLSMPVITVKVDSSIGEAAETMLKNRMRHLLVLDRENNTAGIISATDIVAFVKENNASMNLADKDVIDELDREGRFYF